MIGAARIPKQDAGLVLDRIDQRSNGELSVLVRVSEEKFPRRHDVPCVARPRQPGKLGLGEAVAKAEMLLSPRELAAVEPADLRHTSAGKAFAMAAVQLLERGFVGGIEEE